MNSNWNSVCLDGDWELFIEENRNLNSESYSTLDELKNSGFLNIRGTVPGNFELDMQREGLLPDLFYSDNSLMARKLENHHLWYVLNFDTTVTDEKQYLYFEGIDTFSEIYLNGQLIGETDNMLIPYEFEAKGIKNGRNELLVHILPVFLNSRKNVFEAGVTYHQPYNSDSVTVRKAPHMFGWDIMPRILSGGIWRSVYLFQKPETCIEDIYVTTIKANESIGTFHIYYRLNIEDDFIEDYRLLISGNCKDSSFSMEKPLWHTEGRTFAHVQNPELWWPKGMGDPNLYDIKIQLLKGDKILDIYTLKSGLRMVELETTDVIEENGEGEFLFKVNGEKMFVKGTNWVPLDAFHSRDKERLPETLQLLDESNCNMVRCWGGNVYEQDEFFRFCDEKGIAVWQDFAMACSFYPQDEDFRKKLKYEAEQIVKRLRNFTSLFIWVGDNECDIAIAGWHPVRQNPNLNRLTRELLPHVIQDFDPFRLYMPSSPYISQKAFERKMERRVPEYHLWGPRAYYKAEFYSKAVCRFASETGYHGSPHVESIKKFLAPDKIWPWQDNSDWHIHATSMEKRKGAAYANRIPVMDNQIFSLFGFHPDNINDFVLASQLTQAEADKYFVERFRLGKWENNTGILMWNLKDGWPQFSDAVVDYYGKKKLAFDVLKRCQEYVCLMFREPDNGKLTLACANDTLKSVNIKYRVLDITNDVEVMSGEAEIEKNITSDIGSIACDTSETVFYLIEWEIEGKIYRNHYLCGEAPVSLKTCIDGYSKCGFLNDFAISERKV